MSAKSEFAKFIGWLIGGTVTAFCGLVAIFWIASTIFA